MKFDDFVFADELKEELKFFDDNPQEITRGLCFHGLPGIGKTSFAKYLAQKHSKNIVYVDCNAQATGSKKHTIFSDWQKVVGHYGGNNIGDDGKEKHFQHAIIFDEWHDLTIKQQHNWKIPFDEMFELTNNTSFRILVILCLNTSNENDTASKKLRLDKLVASAIRSRCDTIEFSPVAGHENEIINGFLRLYPKANEDKMCDAYPDLRDMTAIGERSKRFSK